MADKKPTPTPTPKHPVDPPPRHPDSGGEHSSADPPGYKMPKPPGK